MFGDYCRSCCRGAYLCTAYHVSIPQSLNPVHRAAAGQLPDARCPKLSSLSLRGKGDMVCQQSFQLLTIFLLVVGIVVAGVVVYHKNWAWKTRWTLLWLLPLGISYYLLFWYFVLTVMRVLAPWDQWASIAPPPGTWERHLNDFFKNPTHAYLAGAWLTGISMGIFFLRFLRERAARANLAIAFTVINFGFLLVAFFLILLVPTSPLDYGSIWIDRVVTAILTILLWGAQLRVPSSASR